MRSYKIRDIKTFMSEVLTRETFDDFLLSEAKITGKASFYLSGRPAEGFFDGDEHAPKDDYVSYGSVRDVCFQMIKGSRIPESFMFMFLLPKDKLESFLETTESTLQPSDVESLSILVRFKDGQLFVITGSSLKIFTMDKTVNDAWDKKTEELLNTIGIDWEVVV